MRKGFMDEARDSQIMFRRLLTAMAHPGTLMESPVEISPPEELHHAAGAILLALLDDETPLWSHLRTGSEEIQWLRFHTGAPGTLNPTNALFALETSWKNLNDPTCYYPGSTMAPESATTLIVQAPAIVGSGGLSLTGPGIETRTTLHIEGVNASFFHHRSKLKNQYPLGVDMVFVSHTTFVAIPRTISIEVTP